MLAYFVNSEGINQASKRNYTTAIKMLLSSLAEISKKDDHANQSITWFYIGKSHWELKQPQKALPYLMKVDSVFNAKNYIRTDQRETYEILIDYYKSKNDPHNQLRYINTLLKVDRELTTNHTYLLQKVIKEYDTQKLLQERYKVENTLRFKNTIKSIIIASMAILVLALCYRHFKTRRNYQQKFRELMEKNTSSTRSEPCTMKEAIADISPDVIAAVTINMQRFEQKKEFLQKDLTQVRLAAILNTNTRYIPKIVWQNTGKSTIDYVCDLKIDYIVELLKNDSRARNYTNKALGEEAGFGSTQNFTRAFKSRTGISPTYFIAELKKTIEEGYSE